MRDLAGLTDIDGWDDNNDPETQLLPTQEEIAPFDDSTDRLLETHEGLIDFDIDDRNVMIGIVPPEDTNRGDSTEHSHDAVPVFKVGDLGIVRAFRGHHRDSMLALSSSRVLGNQWCNTPEQFSNAWNYCSETDADVMSADDGAAGKYDWWTNLWQVARLMAIIVRYSMDPASRRVSRTRLVLITMCRLTSTTRKYRLTVYGYPSLNRAVLPTQSGRMEATFLTRACTATMTSLCGPL